MKKMASIFCLGLLVLSCTSSPALKKYVLQGNAFGTSYAITYFGAAINEALISSEIYKKFDSLNLSLSTYIPNSAISKINRGDTTVLVDAYFEEVFKKSKKIFSETDGVFDPTIGALVNAWGFGPETHQKAPDSIEIHDLRNKIGFEKVNLVNGKIRKKFEIYFDFNALAKGYALDLVGRYLETLHINNYMIEIGGEIRTRGKQIAEERAWTVAIEKPNFDGTRSIDQVINLENKSMATSGGYRKFNVDPATGKKYIHIIDPKTGYPSQHNLLSVSVIAALDCADVDGYATAILAMGVDDAKAFLEKRQDLMALLIYSTADGNMAHYFSSNFKGLNNGF